MQVKGAIKHILEKLKVNLPEYLLYHSVSHVRDVKVQAMRIAKSEGVFDQEDLELLETAAIYHDCGFLSTYTNHEEKGCEIAREVLSQYEYTPAQIKIIEGLIMATKVPQKPKTKLEEIICDADLDYLGRDDFFVIGDYLYEELLHIGVVKDEMSWNHLQIKFLTAHHYFTKTNIKDREPLKFENLKKIIKKVEK
ncbi:MAG: HD domain-containing protein [bacterium]|nr:HD domain-containing protein [bacterium]